MRIHEYIHTYTHTYIQVYPTAHIVLPGQNQLAEEKHSNVHTPQQTTWSLSIRTMT